MILKFIDKGNLVPDSITDKMVLDRLQQSDAQEKGILLDGYPRNIHQANEILKVLASVNKTLDLVL